MFLKGIIQLTRVIWKLRWKQNLNHLILYRILFTFIVSKSVWIYSPDFMIFFILLFSARYFTCPMKILYNNQNVTVIHWGSGNQCWTQVRCGWVLNLLYCERLESHSYDISNCIAVLFGKCAYGRKPVLRDNRKLHVRYITYITVNFRCAYIRVEAHVHLFTYRRICKKAQQYST